ncbi:hypothetical protein SmJEL517_g04483 [Synchytrium microbalum]|uniref:protein xylosyltransferase n=1 Tax=Synchytrium microbalum TaxID=1806994 RepID=A0A507BZB1_9FUNG|nr:uncharacterized protein SmJEL517_g04483 [Synchytrium microbalum]TPX32471.1 hypothetical protein SmJEL517_g04483 [Synchytrium microbalum]
MSSRPKSRLWKDLKRLNKLIWVTFFFGILIWTLKPNRRQYDPMIDLHSLEHSSGLEITGFEYCNQLNGSRFLNVASPFGTIGKSSFPKRFDAEARKLEGLLQTGRFESESLRKLSCYLLATGRAHSNSVNLIQAFEPSTYFPMVSYKPSKLQRAKHRMAFVILAHNINQLNNLKIIIKELVSDQPHSIVMIHVDSREAELGRRLESWAEQYFLQSSRVIVNSRQIRSTWGSAQLVFATLDCFFKLLDVSEFDYIINLSANDYPLLRPDAMYANLKADERNGHRQSWIGARKAEEFADRWSKPFVFTSKDQIEPIQWHHAGKAFHHTLAFDIFKHPQWVVLSRDHVEAFRTDQRLIAWLAFCDYIFIPDEIYFGTGLMSIQEYGNNTIPISRTFAKFDPGNYHPVFVDYQRRHSLLVADPPDLNNSLVPYLMARKIYISKEAKLRKWIDYKLRDNDSSAPCDEDDVSFKETCVVKALHNLSQQGTPILVPINIASRPLAMNLHCSLRKLDGTNVLFWALDEVTHNRLLEQDLMSYHNQARFRRFPYEVTWADYEFAQFTSGKPSFLKLALKHASRGIWSIDADVVVLKDLDLLIEGDADLYVMMDMTSNQRQSRLPLVSTGVIFLRNTPGAFSILEKMIEYSPTLHDDAVALNKVMGDSSLVSVQGHDGKWLSTPKRQGSRKAVVRLLSSSAIVNGHTFNATSFDKGSVTAVHLNGVLDYKDKIPPRKPYNSIGNFKIVMEGKKEEREESPKPAPGLRQIMKKSVSGIRFTALLENATPDTQDAAPIESPERHLHWETPDAPVQARSSMPRQEGKKEKVTDVPQDASTKEPLNVKESTLKEPQNKLIMKSATISEYTSRSPSVMEYENNESMEHRRRESEAWFTPAPLATTPAHPSHTSTSNSMTYEVGGAREISETLLMKVVEMKWGFAALVVNVILIIFVKELEASVWMPMSVSTLTALAAVIWEVVLLFANVLTLLALNDAAAAYFGFRLCSKGGISFVVTGFLQVSTYKKFNFASNLSLNSTCRSLLAKISLIWISIEALKLLTPISATALRTKTNRIESGSVHCIVYEEVGAPALGVVRSEVTADYTTAVMSPQIIGAVNDGDGIVSSGFSTDVFTNCSCTPFANSTGFEVVGVPLSASSSLLSRWSAVTSPIGFGNVILHNSSVVTIYSAFSGLPICGGNSTAFVPVCRTTFSNHSQAKVYTDYMTDGTTASIAQKTVELQNITGPAITDPWLVSALTTILNGPANTINLTPTIPSVLSPLLWWTSGDLISVDPSMIEAGLETTFTILLRAGMQRTYATSGQSCIVQVNDPQSSVLSMEPYGVYVTMVFLSVQLLFSILSLCCFCHWIWSEVPIFPGIRAMREPIWL